MKIPLGIKFLLEARTIIHCRFKILAVIILRYVFDNLYPACSAVVQYLIWQPTRSIDCPFWGMMMLSRAGTEVMWA